MSGILGAVIVVGGVGIIIAVILVVAGKFFAVEVNEKEAAIREVLPGNNCGGCGYPGCDGLAAAIPYVSLTCTNCPDVVQALNVMATLNSRITHETVDGA